jgi:hypothetical protein
MFSLVIPSILGSALHLTPMLSESATLVTFGLILVGSARAFRGRFGREIDPVSR